MAYLVKFDTFITDMAHAYHDMFNDEFRLILSNTEPNLEDVYYTDIVEIESGNGYQQGGPIFDSSGGFNQNGVFVIQFSDISIAAYGGDIGPFRYVAIYNGNNDLLVAYSDLGELITITNGFTFVINFNDVIDLTNIIQDGEGNLIDSGNPTSYDVDFSMIDFETNDFY